jgi:hypothetical protein
MASAAMIDDRLQIDGFEPRTWSGSYGLNTDGFPKKIWIDGSYTTQISPEPMEIDERPLGAEDPNMDLAGNMYLKTGYPSPAPYDLYPARKYEYPDGRVTWERPGQPFDFSGDEATIAVKKQVGPKKMDRMILYLFVIIIVFYLASKIEKV